MSASRTWENVTPAVSMDPNNPTNNYGFTALALDPKKPSTVYVGTCYQGLMKSIDAGKTWFKVNTGPGGSLLDSGRLWTLAIDPVNPRILYTTPGYGVGGVLKSTDGGVSWTDVFSSSPQAKTIGTNYVGNIVTDPFLANHLLVSFHYWWHGNQSSGIVESKDGGQTWVIHNPAGNWNWGNEVSFAGNSSTWTVGTDTSGVWRTADSGATWQQVWTGDLSHGKSPLYRNPATGALFMVAGTGFIKSTDNGATWTDISSGIPYAYYSTVIGDGTTLYTAPNYPDLGDNSQAHGPWYTLPESGGTSWQPYSSQTTCSASYCNGPAFMAYDPVNHVVYSSNGLAGVWKLRERRIRGTGMSGRNDK